VHRSIAVVTSLRLRPCREGWLSLTVKVHRHCSDCARLGDAQWPNQTVATESFHVHALLNLSKVQTTHNGKLQLI